MTIPEYVYALVRADLPLADQIVQVGHACLEAGVRFISKPETLHLVVLQVPSERDLLAFLENLHIKGIQFTVFEEPDEHMGFTAACTEPLKTRQKREFRHLPLWASSISKIILDHPPPL